MELETTQTLLARLYTDQAFREALIEDPQSATRQYGLSEEEAICRHSIGARPKFRTGTVPQALWPNCK